MIYNIWKTWRDKVNTEIINKFIKKMKFQHGQAVTCEINNIKIKNAKISIGKDGTPYICHNDIMCAGSVAPDLLGYKFSWGLKQDFTSMVVFDLKPYVNTFYDIIEGDVVGDNQGCKAKLLGRAGSVLFFSIWRRDGVSDDFGFTTTVGWMERAGKYKFVNEDDSKVLELTLEQIAEKFGKNVADIKIKK